MLTTVHPQLCTCCFWALWLDDTGWTCHNVPQLDSKLPKVAKNPSDLLLQFNSRALFETHILLYTVFGQKHQERTQRAKHNINTSSSTSSGMAISCNWGQHTLQRFAWMLQQTQFQDQSLVGPYDTYITNISSNLTRSKLFLTPTLLMTKLLTKM